MGKDLTGLGSVAEFATGIIDRIFPKSASAEDKLAAGIELEKAMTDRENTVVQAKTAVMVAELNQDDKYTKRGRPTIIYGGLLIIFLNHVFTPSLAWFAAVVAAFFPDRGVTLPAMPTLTLPAEFWLTWGGVCGVYVLGRTKEKSGQAVNGVIGKAYNLISGKKSANG